MKDPVSHREPTDVLGSRCAGPILAQGLLTDGLLGPTPPRANSGSRRGSEDSG